ncbi:MAG: hypothetical protein K2G81_01540 [Muribaculaceae bacterium]|nr:hypothetical protein [Muribaculaceae bacterium]
MTEARPSLISPLTASLSAVFPARGVKTVVQSNEFFGNYASFCTHFYLTQAQKLNPDAFSQSKEKRKKAKEKQKTFAFFPKKEITKHGPLRDGSRP